MNINIILKIFNRDIRLSLLLLIMICGFLSSCVEDVLNLRTVKGQMIGEYLEENSDKFSEFSKLLDTTQVKGLVNGYGQYTIFAPNNKAMQAFYQSKGKSSLKNFSLDTLKRIAYDHLIKGYVITSDLFSDGLMPYLTMSDRFVSTSSQNRGNNLIYFVNDNSAILAKDIVLSNGVVQVIDKVLNPSQLSLIEAIAADKKFTIFNEALNKTGLVNQLLAKRDETYDPKNYSSIDLTNIQGSGSKDELPVSRKYGFTALMESDSIYKLNGINTFEDLKIFAASHVYYELGEADVSDITDSRNSLNRFIAYHLINKKLTYSKFIDDYDNDNMIKTYDMYEYIETMCSNTLMEIKKERLTGESNLINKSRETGQAIRIVNTYKDKDAINGVYHEIDRILMYDNQVAGEMSSKRLRMDAASFFPEFTNNNMRYYDPTHPRSWVFPQGYIKRLKCSETTRFCYLNAFGGYLDYEGDEVYLKGMYDFSVETLPIPAGTYEVRFAYQPTGGRGAAQLYWDSIPCGIPLDLRINADAPLIGFVKSGTNPEDPNGYENDKMMRNRGYMKGPSTFLDHLGLWYGNAIARDSKQYLRRILGTYTFTKAGTHVFTVKAVREGQFMFDFLEFVPVELIENEGVD